MNWIDSIPRVIMSPFILHALMFFLVKFCIFNEWVSDFFFDLLYPYTKVVFQSSLKKIRREGTETPELRLHGYRLRCTLLQISSVTSLVVAASFLAFWDTFLIKQTFVCDPRLDCFYREGKTIPLENCTYATENVVCFEFVFDIVGGFSSAIGVLGISVLYFNMSLTVFFWFKKMSHTRLSKRWLKLCFSCSSHIVCCGQFLMNISWIVLIFTVPVITNIFLLSGLCGVKGVAYYWVFISLLTYIPNLYSLTSPPKSSVSQELPNQTSLVIENQSGDSDSQDPPSLIIEIPSHSQHSQGPLNNEQSFDNETQSDLQDPTRHPQFEHQDSPNNEVA